MANLNSLVAASFSSLSLLSSSVSTANLSCVVATSIFSPAFLSSSVCMANLSCFVAASLSSLALLSVSTANLSHLLETTFSSHSFLSNSFSPPCFNNCDSGQALFVVVFCFWRPFISLFCYFLVLLLLNLFRVLSSTFLSSFLQSLKLCLL